MTAPALTPDRLHRPLPGPASRREAPEEIGVYQFQVVAANVADEVLLWGRHHHQGLYSMV